MKGVEVLEITYAIPKLRDGVMCDEMLVICVTAKLGGATVCGNELETQ